MAKQLFRLEFKPIETGLDKFDSRFNDMLSMYFSTKAAVLESNMKKNKNWTDRTGMAKATLTARLSKPSPAKFRITCSHGVDYGVWLELANEKNYAIVGPTIEHDSNAVFQGLQNILSKLG